MHLVILRVCLSVCPRIMFTSVSFAKMIAFPVAFLAVNPVPVLPTLVLLPHRSVPETTFDLHGDIHSGSAIPTSKVSYPSGSFRCVHVCVCGLTGYLVISELREAGDGAFRERQREGTGEAHDQRRTAGL